MIIIHPNCNLNLKPKNWNKVESCRRDKSLFCINECQVFKISKSFNLLAAGKFQYKSTS